LCFDEKSNLTLNKMYLKWMINLIESLNYAVMYYTDSCTHWLLYTYSRKMHTLDCFNKSEAFSLSHILFSFVSGLCYTKPLSVDMAPMWKLKNDFLDYFLQMLNILTYLYRRDMYNNANHQTHQFDKPCQIFACFLH